MERQDNDWIVEIKDMSFSYAEGSRVILDDVSLSFRKGEVIAIMGGSGMGKTTLLKLIGGLLTPDKGEVFIDGERLNTANLESLYRIRRKMGMLFQFGALFTDMTVFNNVAFPLREHTDLPEALIRDLVLLKLNAVGLRGAAQLYPSEISGGMSRRVALARTVALDPMLIMYDEPFAGLDFYGRDRSADPQFEHCSRLNKSDRHARRSGNVRHRRLRLYDFQRKSRCTRNT